MSSRTSRTAALMAIAALALAGCTHPATAETVGPTVSNPETPSPTPTPTPSQAEQDAKTAGDTVIGFWKLADQLAQDPSRKVEELQSLSKGQTYKSESNDILGYRAEELHQVGNTVVKVASSTYVGSQAWEVKGCSDVSGSYLADRSGKSAKPAGRPDFYSFTNRVEKGDDGKFYVVSDTSQVASSC